MNTIDKGTDTGMRLGKIKRIQRLSSPNQHWSKHRTDT